MKSAYMYILECADGSFYTGSTIDLELRLFEHNSGAAANFTAKRRPVKIIYNEEFDNIESAFLREKQIKKWSRAKKKALIEGDIVKLKSLARKN